MNHLAHALVAGSDAQIVLGSLLGDFWRGAPDPAWSAATRAGLFLHRRVDGFTDSDAQLARARALFQPPFRRYAGIMLDVYFDHLLAQRFAQFSAQSLDEYSGWILALLDTAKADLPEPMRRFVAYMRAHGLFASYANRAMLGQVLEGISHRLTRANPLAGSDRVLDDLAQPLGEAFVEFFPRLQEFASHELASLLAVG
jgi:acyl carrier protein phosphodiesterase